MRVAVGLLALLAEDHQVLAGNPGVLLVREVAGQGLEDDVRGALELGQFLLHLFSEGTQVVRGLDFGHADLFQHILPQADELEHGGGGSIGGRNAVLHAADLSAGHLAVRDHVLHGFGPALGDQVVQGLGFLLVHHRGQVRQAVPVQVDRFLRAEHDAPQLRKRKFTFIFSSARTFSAKAPFRKLDISSVSSPG